MLVEIQFIPGKKYQMEYLPRKKFVLYARHRKILGKPVLTKKVLFVIFSRE